MSYEVANATKSLGQFASNSGYGALIHAAGLYPAAGYPKLAEWFHHGVSKDVDECVEELERLAADHEDKSIKSTATGLADLIRDQNIAVIHNGLTSGKKSAQKLAKADNLLKVSPSDDLPGRDTAEKAIKKALAEALAALETEAAGEIVSGYEAGDSAGEIADALDLEDLDGLAVPVGEALESVAGAGARKALKSLRITDSKLFDLANENAAAFARDRGAELVGRKWIDGELVDNPDARWAITDSTRDMLRNLIERAYTDGMTPAQLKSEIRGNTTFSPERARNIAKTETAKASIQGTLEGWKASGLVEGKQSLLSDDHDQDDECDDAAEDGAIPVDDDFSTGDAGPPYHPGCNCSLIAVMVKE